MRQERTVQASLFDRFAGHEIGRELQAMSAWLDDHRALLGLVPADLRRHGVKETGRQGLPAEAVLRCVAQAAPPAELPGAGVPSGGLGVVSGLCPAAVVVEPAEVGAAPARSGRRPGSRSTGRCWRAPQGEAGARAGGAAGQHRHRDRQRAAKKRARDIQYTRGRPQRGQLYRELIKITRATLAYLHQAALPLARAAGLAVALWQAKVRHYRPLIEQIIAQSERRVLAGEPVPASKKLVSLFEPHADLIRKGSAVAYGHKLNLSTGRSGLILDLVIEAGNPAASARLLPMLERHVARYGQPPRQAAADGSYASRDNLSQAKARGVRDMAFHKKAGLRIEDMVRSRWVYRQLRNFRAAGISCLKRAYGRARCTWRGLDHVRAYVWSSVVAYNLALLARLQPA